MMRAQTRTLLIESRAEMYLYYGKLLIEQEIIICVRVRFLDEVYGLWPKINNAKPRGDSIGIPWHNNKIINKIKPRERERGGS